MKLPHRSRLLPYALLTVGLGLLVAFVVVLLTRGQARRPAAPAPSTTTAPPQSTAPPTIAPPPTTTAPTTAPPPPPPPAPSTTAPPPSTAPSGLAISNIQIAALTPFSATITWQTNVATSGRASYGPAGTDPVLWSAADGPATSHSSTLPGLSFGLAYHAVLSATAADGRQAQAAVDLATPAAPTSPTASTANGAVLVDGQPFFPVLIYGNCPNTYNGAVGAGANLFMENPCGGVPAQVQALSGKALSASPVNEAGATGDGLIGWYYGDESDAHSTTLPDHPQYPGRLSFLTLTDHFYSQSGLLPQGRAFYPGMIAASDVVGFDLYPLQNWCQAGRLGDVYAAQQELVRLAAGRPTYQWIEVASMGCSDPALAVTPDTVRAESWLAIAGGAHGLGFFPGQWTPDVDSAIRQVTREIAELAPALLAPAVPASAPASVRVGARAYGGAVYVIAVNPSGSATRATIRVRGLPDGPLSVVGEGRTVAARGGRFTDPFGPLAVHVYVAPPR